jgi:D-lactate dehydrogenase
MKVTFFSTHSYDKTFFAHENLQYGHELSYFSTHLDAQTVMLAKGADAVCTFVNDELNETTLKALLSLNVKTVALRCAGFNQVNIEAAQRLGITVVRVPEYSPYAVAEHTLALILSLNRKIHLAHNRVRDGNFRLAGLLGFDMHGKTVGIIGTGKIGVEFCRIMSGFGCRLLASDVYKNPACLALGVEYVALNELLEQADIISLHCPLTPQTHHIINEENLARIKPGAMLVNTSRGALIDTPALIDALKSGRLGNVALDVYEEEGDLFFEDLSSQVIQDDVFARLLTFPNVLMTAHQAFFTEDALRNIAHTTLNNLSQIEHGEKCPNMVLPQSHKSG